MTDFSKQPVLVFDIETIADIDGARRVYPQLANLNDEDALTALTSLRLQESGDDFMRLPLHKIVCISVFYLKDGQPAFLRAFENNAESNRARAEMEKAGN